jgi:hypothetical protein
LTFAPREFIFVVLKRAYNDKALSGQTVLFPENCGFAAKMTLWLCPVILYGYGNAAKSEPAEIA